MARFIRRHSMERLELYDLDKLITSPTSTLSLSSTLPPPRKSQQRRPSVNPLYERYKFLCNMTRSNTDPIYAATPMFTTIPQSSQEKSPHQLLGSYVRLENVTSMSYRSSKSPESKTTEIIDEEKENEDDHNDNKNQSDGESSTSSEEKNHDDDAKGIVQRIFNREEKKLN